jgi:formylglycine-generating enzyme required for sulfatase activity
VLSEEERFRELDLLVRDYDAIIAGLQEGKATYEAFFTQLVAGVRQAVKHKSDEIRHLEQERAALHRSAVAHQDSALEQWATQSAEQLWQSVRLLGQATILLLKKVALCQEGVKKLAEDQELQRHVLAQLVGQLQNHRRAYALQQQIDRMVREVAEMAEVALHFEHYMRDHFGPLQGLLEQVVKADASLHKAVAEIETITRQMLRQHCVSFPKTEAFDLRMLHFLTASTLKRERLVEVLERLERQEGTEEAWDIELATSDAPTLAVQEVLDNIEALIAARLAPLTLWSNRLGMEFVLIPAGTFLMGAAQGAADERPVHQVTINRPFYLGRYPVTQTQWTTVMQTNPSGFLGEQQPVENVSWEEIQQFLHRLNAKEGGAPYRLPTEAEWEYAARAGSTTAYCFGDDASQLHEYAWYKANAGGKTHPVGQRKPNAWGLYDMHGNVWEWVQDWYGAYAAEAIGDPQGPSSGASRVRRGGSWSTGAESCRLARRDGMASGRLLASLGFRLLREVL